jgi:deoxyribodipyrimidine photolyase-related protein
MEATLVYPHQLLARHPGVARGRGILLIEDPLFFGNDPHWQTAMHRQKLVLHRASMKAYAGQLSASGHEVTYLETPDGCDTDSAAWLNANVPHDLTALHLANPADHILMRRVRRFASARGIQLVVHDSPNFLSPSEFLEAHIANRKRPFMARFYEAQRKRMDLLVDPDGSPAGGQWSFDAQNRARYPKNGSPPEEPRANSNEFVQEAVQYVIRRFPDNPGSIDDFRWAVTHADADAWLDRFLDERFADFGIYEDAISVKHPFLHHSAISPMLNIGLLDPTDVVMRVVARSRSQPAVPLNSVEGLLRQIVGWREFMAGIYRHRGTAIRHGNFWNHDRAMPRAFYDATTGIPPVDRVIRQVLRDGYCHHIERLMVLGNFMLLCRIRPDDIYRWFMELFIDAYDWVMVPNTYGMSQFADGGTFTTKPYLSGSNYLLKMSDETKGPWCEVWDGLFWSFIDDHRAFFLKNPRLSMMVRTWEKMPTEKQQAHRGAASSYLSQL